MFDKNFIEANLSFWSKLKEPDGDNILLVETADHPVINHSNAVVAKMVAHAKNLRIAWLKNKNTNEELMRSYSENSNFITPRKFNFFEKLQIIFKSIFYYLFYVLIFNRIHSFKYKGVPYGDFVYDGYLAIFSMATLHRFDINIIKVFYIVISHDEEARWTLNNHNICAILVAHYMGIITGPLTRVALQKNIGVYWKGGGHEILNFSLFKDLKQIHEYPLKPVSDEIENLACNLSKIVESDFKEFINQVNNPYYGALSVAYNNNIISSDVSRSQFLEDMRLKDRPLIFVMLHAFNDFPHSHFKKMLFDDYYDWFVQTLKLAISDKSKNWIFKEHPANEFYSTKDIDLNKIFNNAPEHIKFASHKSKISASTVLNIADAIVTCIGTSGVEMPALRGIPSIIAGDSFYDGFGFTIEPKSKEEYFKTLNSLSPKILSPEQKLRAECCYMYIKKYTSLPFAAGPAFTYEEVKSPQKLREAYPDRILKCYKEKSDLIYKQFIEYSSEIKKPDFKRLLRLPVNPGV